VKRVAVVGFLWPYISGSKRTIGLATHLHAYGWEPIVVTAPLRAKPETNFQVVESEYIGLFGRAVRSVGLSERHDVGEQLKERVSTWPPLVKSALRGSFRIAMEVLAFPDEHKGWRRFAVEAVDRLVREGEVEAVISVWPVTSHVVARTIKERYRIPWIADLADLWSDNSAYAFGAVRRALDRRCEVRTLGLADVVTTSSSPLAERLRQLHRGKEILPVMMGFDPEQLSKPATPDRARFTVTYTGMFYRGKRDPAMLLRAVSELLREGVLDPARLDVRFYGPRADWVEQEIREYGLQGVVRQFGPVPLDTCLALQRQSQILLQINWSDPEEKGVFSGKFLDYLAARRPVLAAGGVGSDEVVAAILADTNSGIYAPSLSAIKHALRDWYAEYCRNGVVQFRGSTAKIMTYSNAEMAGTFGRTLDHLVEARHNARSA